MIEDVEHTELLKLHTLLSNTDTSIKQIYTFLKSNIHVFRCMDFRKHVLKESFILLMILENSDDLDLISDVIVNILVHLDV